MHSHDEAKIGREIFLRSFFEVRPPRSLAQALVAVMSDHDFKAGDVIFTAGSTATHVYFVVEGKVQLQRDGEFPWTFDEQSVIGIIDAVLARPRSRTAVATADTHALSIRYQDYIEVLQEHFDFATKALENVNRFIHESSRTLAPHHVFKPPETVSVIAPEIIDQRPLNLVERLLVLYNAPFFIGAPVQPLVSFAAVVEEERWSAGTVLFEIGEPSTTLRWLVSGRVRAELDEPRIVGWFGPGDLVGAQAAIGYPETQYRMIAEQDTVILQAEKEDLYDLMEDHARLARLGFAFAARENDRTRALRGIAEHIRAANE